MTRIKRIDEPSCMMNHQDDCFQTSIASQPCLSGKNEADMKILWVITRYGNGKERREMFRRSGMNNCFVVDFMGVLCGYHVAEWRVNSAGIMSGLFKTINHCDGGSIVHNEDNKVLRSNCREIFVEYSKIFRRKLEDE